MVEQSMEPLRNAVRAVTVMGGGRVGRSLIEQLKVAYPEMAIRLVDIRAEDLVLRYAQTLANVEAWQADLGDDRALAASLSGDLVINTAGPFFRYGTRVMSAAIAAGKHYVDVCDESRPLEDMRALTAAAAEQQVLAIVGCGFSPGFPNMIVGNLHRSGFKAADVQIAWCTSMADPVGRAAAMHALHIVRPPARHLSGGRLCEVVPLQGGRVIDFPAPFGSQETFDVEHSEPVTLSASFDGLKSVWVGGAILPEVAIRRLKAYAELGLAEPSTVRVQEDDIARAAIVAALDREYWSKFELEPNLPEAGAVVVDAEDRTGSKERYALIGPMAQSTAAGAMGGLAALVRHVNAGRFGVLFSEEAIDWSEYYRAVLAVGAAVHHHEQGRWVIVGTDNGFPRNPV